VSLHNAFRGWRPCAAWKGLRLRRLPHTAEVLADWLGLDDAAVAGLRQDGIV
jgi:hypothetical protein